MRILLTGASGKLGRAIRRAAAGSHELVLCDTDERIRDEGGTVADVTDAEAMRHLAEGCDAIIHTAALHGRWYGKASHAQFIKANVLGAENLFQAALLHGVRRLAMSSTMEVLIGRRWDASGVGAFVDETSPPRPDWIYPVTKLQVEQLGSLYARHFGLEVIHLRYMGIYDEPIERIGFGLLARHVAADDCASANLLALTTPGLSDEVLHIGPDTPLTPRDVRDALTDIWPVLERHWPGVTGFCRRNTLAPTEKQRLWPVTSIARAKRTLGWKPALTFDGYLRNLGWKPVVLAENPHVYTPYV